VLLGLAVLAAGLWVAGLGLGEHLGWHPDLTDFHVYLTAGHNWATHQDLYSDDPYLAFLYPPLTAVPFALLDLLPFGVLAVAWTCGNALLVPWILHRVGLAWPRALLAAVLVILIMKPVSETIRLGQVNLALCALVLAAFLPARSLAREGRGGVLVGLAAAIKLTPALFVAYGLLQRRWRLCLAAVGTVVATIALGFAVAPHDSVVFWTRLAHGQTGLGGTTIYLYNQSVSGALLRLFGGAGHVGTIALGVSALVAVGAVLVALPWARTDRVGAVTLVGLGTLLASPVSWTNHFVWLVPLGVWCALRWRAVLLGRGTSGSPRGPLVAALAVGSVLVVWMSLCPFGVLPSGGNVEYGYGIGARLLSSVTVALGLAYGILMVAARPRA